MTSCLAQPLMWTTMKAYDVSQDDVVSAADSYSYKFNEAMAFNAFPIQPIYHDAAISVQIGNGMDADDSRDPFRGGDPAATCFAFEVEYSA